MAVETPEVGNPSAAGPRQYHWKIVWKRRIASVARWLHIYLSMVSFAILFFFAVTGLTANHTEWFAARQRTVQRRGAVDVKWSRSAAKLEIVEYLRSSAGVKGALNDFRVDDGQCSVSFKGPGYAADVSIDRDTGKYQLTETRMGFAAILNDLHKGRDSGQVWKWLIDISAVLMTLVAISGMALIFFLARRRVSGLVCLAVGAAMCYAVYVIFVP
jgi:hypothetical protein